jgi:hypothetical protein
MTKGFRRLLEELFKREGLEVYALRRTEAIAS